MVKTIHTPCFISFILQMFEGETIMMSWKLLDFFFFSGILMKDVTIQSVFMYLSETS